MADIPQEVREAPMSDHERFIAAVAFDCGFRAGMERAAEIADDHGTAWGLAGGTSATVIAQAIRSANDG